MSKNVLVIGGKGFIGSATCKQLEQAGHIVRPFDPAGNRFRGIPAHDISMGSELLVHDLLWADVVINLAASMGFHARYSRYWGKSTQGAAKLFEVLQREKIELERIVLGSSQAVYGEADVPYRAQMRSEKDGVSTDHYFPTYPKPQSAYGLSKLHQEEVHRFFCNQMDIPLSILRYSIVVGPGQSVRDPYMGLIRSVAMACLHGDQPVIFEDGQQKRDFVHVEDVARANAAGVDGLMDGIHNVTGMEDAVTVNTVAKVIMAFLEFKGEIEYPGLARLGDTRHVYSEPDRDWMTRHPALKGIEDFCDELRASDWQSLPYTPPAQAIADLKERGELVPWNG